MRHHMLPADEDEALFVSLRRKHLHSDANADDCLPTGLGGQKRKRKTGGAKQAAKAASDRTMLVHQARRAWQIPYNKATGPLVPRTYRKPTHPKAVHYDFPMLIPPCATNLEAEADEQTSEDSSGVRGLAAASAAVTARHPMADEDEDEALFVAQIARNEAAHRVTGAGGAEVGASRKRAAQNAPSRSDPGPLGGKKAKHAARHAAANEQRADESAEADDGGYALLAKGEATRDGVIFAVAKKWEEARTCLADAVFALLNALFALSLLGQKVKIETVRAALPATETKDPNQKMAKEFASDHGVTLVHQPQMTGSPRTLLKEISGVFLVRLAITVADDSTDFHYVCFDAAVRLIIDNEAYRKFATIGDEDLKNNKAAILPFFYLFPKAKGIRISSVLKGVVGMP